MIRYPVSHPLLKKYIAFFWELRFDHIHLNHKIIPQKNINLRFNLSETRHYSNASIKSPLEDVYFLGLQDQFANHHLIINGNVDVLGISFHPNGFYPFVGIPVSEFRNQLLGAGEIGFKPALHMLSRLKQANDISSRLKILEDELLLLLINKDKAIYPEFHQVINSVRFSNETKGFSELCRQANLSMRTLERLFNKYVGIPASTYNNLNRFHSSVNKMLWNQYDKFTDLAYDNGYFDQMHFIRDFKRFAGNTPKEFVHLNNSLVHIGRNQ